MIALQRSRAVLATAAALTVEVAAVAGLTSLGRRPAFAVPFDRLEEWVRVTPPADALVAALRWIALVGAWWLLGGTLVYVVVVATRLPRAARTVRWVALPPVRRAVDAALAATVVTGAVFAPAASASGAPPPSTTVVRDGRGGLASLPAAPGPTAPAPVAPPPPPAPAPSPPAPPAPPEDRVVVAPGDNLWELAARRIARATGRDRAAVADGEITPYWAAVCEQNRASLASGDPDLIFPGEVVVLPRVS